MTNQIPTVSVIIPVFNGAQYIKGAVESVFAQTFKDLEIIVVDDGSTDGTKTVLESWIRERKINYIFQDNKGLAGARNTGIRQAKGKYLKFLDCDDLLYTHQLELQVAHLEKKAEHFISATNHDLEFPGKNKKTIKLKFSNRSQLARFIAANPFPVHTILIRRRAVERAGGFDENLKTQEDSDLWFRVLLQGGIFEKLDYVGCCYRILDGSLSCDPQKMFTQSCLIFEKLNRSLLQRVVQLPRDVSEQLLASNDRLMHTCFALKTDPSSCLPETLRISTMVYGAQVSGVRQFLLKTIGIKNISYLKFVRTSMKDRKYPESLLHLSWRDEKSYA